MADQPRLLVVDDEEAICEGCSRIFSRQGFDVSKSSSARDGLALAQAEQYSAVLLDIKMPEMSGLDFLSQLREQKVDVPVILMTGFPTMPNAISAVRLGASGYVTKPFTPEEITQAVHQFVPQASDAASNEDSTSDESEGPLPDESRLFWHEAWLQPAGNDLVRVGAVLAGFAGKQIRQIELPRIGEVVYQGLPMARVTLTGGDVRLVPAPMTGVVEHCNERLVHDPELLRNEPCARGWIAELCATRANDEVNHCAERQILIVSNDSEQALSQASHLTALGCSAATSAAPTDDSQWEEFAALLPPRESGVLVLDAMSLGDKGPEIVSRINAIAPEAKVIVAASPNCSCEAAYRARKIFYYGVDLFQDHEVTDVVDSAFRARVSGRAKPIRPTRNNEAIESITITNRLGTRVTLIAEPGLLFRNTGLGSEIRALLYEGLFPIQTMPGIASVAPRDVLNAAHSCDAVFLLLSRDTGRLPGALARNSGTEFAALTDGNASKVTTLVVQPVDDEINANGLDDRTLARLAGHIVTCMATATK
jgi:FixJ family two-component response regulator